MSLRPKRALLASVIAAAALAALPAAASATVTPSLTLDQSAGTTAGSSPATGFNATFTATTGDAVKDISLSLPPGLLANETINGGACLVSSTPTSACQVGTGTVTLGTTQVPVTVDLVKPPNAADVGGLAIVSGSTTLSTGDLTLGASGATVAFSNVTNGLAAISLRLTNLRLPSSCPSPAATIKLTTDSQQSATPVSTTAPLNVTGCSSLAYSPNLTAAIKADSKGNAELTLGVTQAATEAASKTISVKFPTGLNPNAGPLLPCLTGGPACTIGTATATSPLVPSKLTGAVTLGGSATSPTFAVVFPAPVNTTINGSVSLSTNSVTFANVPDIPLTDLTLDVTGPSGGRAFTTDCAPGSVSGSFTGQGGQTHTATAPITYTGCHPKPTASGSTSGVAKGKPRLKFKVTHAKGTPNISTVSVGLPSGLKFSRSAIVSHKVCTKKGKKRTCKTTTLIKGLGVSGGTPKTVAIKGGRLVITLKKAAASVSITAVGPLVTESKSLQTKVKKHKVKTLSFTLKVTDAKHASTTLTLKLPAH